MSSRPADIPETEAHASSSKGFRAATCSWRARTPIYAHVRLSRNIAKDDVHIRLERKDSAWELTVVTLDKPFLFSNICGVLSSFGMDILRGHAMTTPNGLVLDIVQFVDQERYPRAESAEAGERFSAVLSDVVSGRADVTERLRRREQSVLRRGARGFRPSCPAGRSVFDTRFVFEALGGPGDGGRRPAVTEVSAMGGEVEYPLVLAVSGGDDPAVQLRDDRGCYDEPTALRLLAEYVRLLGALTGVDPATRLDALALLPAPGRAARPEPVAEQRPATAPRTPDERALAAIWSEILGVTDIHVHDDFFDLGGDSILVFAS